MPFLAAMSLPPAMAIAPKAPNLALCAVAATNESFSRVTTPDGRPQKRRNLKQLQSVFTPRNVKLRRANVSAAANTTDRDSIAREARTGSGLGATGAASSGGGGAESPRSDLDSVASNRREPITRQESFEPLERTRIFFLHQDAIASGARHSFEFGQRGGSGVDWLGTNAPYRCFPV
jgi:hypothetical protein